MTVSPRCIATLLSGVLITIIAPTTYAQTTATSGGSTYSSNEPQDSKNTSGQTGRTSHSRVERDIFALSIPVVVAGVAYQSLEGRVNTFGVNIPTPSQSDVPHNYTGSVGNIMNGGGENAASNHVEDGEDHGRMTVTPGQDGASGNVTFTDGRLPGSNGSPGNLGGIVPRPGVPQIPERPGGLSGGTPSPAATVVPEPGALASGSILSVAMLLSMMRGRLRKN